MEAELIEIKKLLQQLLAVELFKSGVPQADIAKRLHIATASVNQMLKGVKRDGSASN
jgi:predicted transcriptional regulator